jgi:hypothetical protein
MARNHAAFAWAGLAGVPAGAMMDRDRHEPRRHAVVVLHGDASWRPQPRTVLA